MKRKVYLYASVCQSDGLMEMDYKDDSVDDIGKMCISCVKELLEQGRDYQEDVPFFWGSELGGVKSQHEFNCTLENAGALGVNPRFFPNAVLNAPSSRVSIHYGIKNPVFNILGGADAGIKAFNMARMYIENGEIENAIVCFAKENSDFADCVKREVTKNFCGAFYLSATEGGYDCETIMEQMKEIVDSEEMFLKVTQSINK